MGEYGRLSKTEKNGRKILVTDVSFLGDSVSFFVSILIFGVSPFNVSNTFLLSDTIKTFYIINVNLKWCERRQRGKYVDLRQKFKCIRRMPQRQVTQSCVN